MLALACALALAAALAGVARAAFPYLPDGGDKHDYSTFHVNQGTTPNDLAGHDNDWHWAASPETSSDPGTAVVNSDPRELNGVRGAHLVDGSHSLHAGWEITTGRPDVAIAVLDSGIMWNNPGDMSDLRKKVRLNRGELPVPQVGGPSLDSGVTCPIAGPANPNDAHDVNDDGVFNVMDYACDPRVSLTDHHEGPAGVLTPQDVIVAFSKGSFHGDDDGNGFVDDIAGWDFLDNDNDPYDDVQYGHGTGEARDSNAEANNGNQAGSCPNCMVVPLRVGDSFVADVNRFAQATIYAVDNNVLVVQEALGTLNNSHLARRAVDYAWNHGVTIIASAADESAQHHNWPSTYDHTLVVNSATKYPTQEFPPGSGMDQPLSPSRKSYLQFNGCTNFSTRVTLSIPSTSCSSDATGQSGGMAGLIYSAAINAHAGGDLDPHPDCHLVNGDPCLVTPNEVRQLIATGSVSSVDADPRANSPDTTNQSDDVNFFSGADAFSCNAPTPGCTDPNALFAGADAARPYAEGLFHSYPARKGYDEFYGFGRVNMIKALDATKAGLVPPEAEIDSPGWYELVDPARTDLDVGGLVDARGQDYTCTLEVAPGSEPNNSDTPTGDFEPVSAGWCDGSTHHTAAHDGTLGTIDLSALQGRFPPGTDFTGPAPTAESNSAGGGTHFNNRPAQEPYGFTLRVVVTAHDGAVTLTGQDRQNEYLHRDADLLPGFPKQLPSDGASSPALADVDGDNKNDLVFGTSDGIVHAMQPDGSELPGWPVHVDPLPLHTGGHAFTSGLLPEDSSYGAVLASPAVADIDHDGAPEVVVADLEGKVYVFDADGHLKQKVEADPKFSGKPLQPFENVRRGRRYRTQHGFIGSPVLANLDGNDKGQLDIVAANMDRHVYAWKPDGSLLPGFPVLVIDRTKVSAIDPTTHTPTFIDNANEDNFEQGAIVDTPAVGDIAGTPSPEIVVGTNEEYTSQHDGGLNVGNLDTATFTALGLALDTSNTRLYAIPATGEPGGPAPPDASPYLPGWPVKLAQLSQHLLPVVGEGVTGSPVIGVVNCPNGGSGPKVGSISDAGPAYIWNPAGTSCYGKSNGHDEALATDFAGGPAQYDHPAVPAVGHPAFADLDGTGTSLISPAAGLLRSLDIVLPEYQGGQDFIAAWNAQSGQFRPGFPTAVNDLQFLTGPSAADIDPNVPGQEIIGGTATLDLNAVSAAGAPLAPAWPKFSGDWMVANPAIGSFGTLDTDSASHKVVIAMTRSGSLFAYSTAAPACSASAWPRFHHDNANSGDLRRDAVSPGKPSDLKLSGVKASFKAPGDDLMCGQVTKYQVATSSAPITGADFDGVVGVDGDKTADPGADQSVALPAVLKRFVAVRAIDDQGNVGRPVVLDRGAGVSGPVENGGESGNGAANNNGGGVPTAGCRDSLAPRSSIARRALRASGRTIRVRGKSRDRGCAGLRRVYVSIALVHGHSCRFVARNGRLTSGRSCRRPRLIRARGLEKWSLKVAGRKLRPGHYRLGVRALDRHGNKERPRRGNSMHFTVR
jgi:hypothetical protein